MYSRGLMEAVIDLGEYRVTRGREIDGCPHHHVTASEETRTIKCDDCGLQIDAYTWLVASLNAQSKVRESLIAREKAVSELEGKSVHLKAARAIQSIWLSRNHQFRGALSCPHCKRGILVTDNLRETSRANELRRRTKEGEASE